jgi:hypothetical protein
MPEFLYGIAPSWAVADDLDHTEYFWHLLPQLLMCAVPVCPCTTNIWRIIATEPVGGEIHVFRQGLTSRRHWLSFACAGCTPAPMR